MSLRYWVATALAICAYLLILCAPVWSLGYPLPQPKQCQTYWDSREAARIVASFPGMIRYSAGPNQALVMIKPPAGMERYAPFVIRYFHDDKGCFLAQRLLNRAALPYALLLASRQDDA